MGEEPRVTGIGGIFFKAKDPPKLAAWYAEHLGVGSAPSDEAGTADSTEDAEPAPQTATFNWRYDSDPERQGMTVWALFPEDTSYFSPAGAPFMVNYRVEDLDAVLESLQNEGVEIDPHREEYGYGRFAWITDPEGNRIELWQPLGE